MIRAAAFDLDDTLYPEQAFVFSGYRAVAAAVEARWGFAIFDELMASFRAGERDDLFTPVLRRHVPEIEELKVKALVSVFRNHKPAIAPFPEAGAVLRAIRRRLPLGLITDGIAAVQERKLGALGLTALFKATVLSGAHGRAHWKPAPLPYELCARRLGLPTKALAYIGDNPAKDFVTARKLGMKTVRVRRPGTLHYKAEAAPGYEADVTLDTLAALPELLERWSNPG